MGLRAWLTRLFTGETEAGPPLPSRHERREAGRRRHRATDAPAWTPDDRHPNPDPGHSVADVAPGTPGAGGSRWIGRRRR